MTPLELVTRRLVDRGSRRNGRDWRPFHHGADEARAWLDAALLLELGQERLVADAVMATVPPSRQDDRERRAAPTGETSTTTRRR